MQADTATIGADTQQKPTGKARLLTLDDVDGRTRAAQQCLQTRDEILGDLGSADSLSTLERCAVTHIAVVDAMIKDIGARWIDGVSVDPTQLTTLMNTFNRTATQLGWQRRQRDVTPSLREYMATAAGEAA